MQVIQSFLGLYPFDTFYIADLDALAGQGNHDELIGELLRQYPNIDFWLDQGFLPYGKFVNKPGNYMPVLGSESYNDGTVAEILRFKGQFVLSLDHSGDEQLGAQRLFAPSPLWPRDIIVMTLARVGSGQGPDIARLSRYCAQHPDGNIIAAGGVRDAQDLLALRQIGVKRVLVASALHGGNLSVDDINNLAGKKIPR